MKGSEEGASPGACWDLEVQLALRWSGGSAEKLRLGDAHMQIQLYFKYVGNSHKVALPLERGNRSMICPPRPKQGTRTQQGRGGDTVSQGSLHLRENQTPGQRHMSVSG